VSRYQKGKTNLDFTEARDSGSGISWATCKSAPRSRQMTTPAPNHSSFLAGRMPFLPPNQQRQSTEGTTPLDMTQLKTDKLASYHKKSFNLYKNS